MKNAIEIDKAIGKLVEKVSNVSNEDQALKYTQAIVNIANAKRVLNDIKKDND